MDFCLAIRGVEKELCDIVFIVLQLGYRCGYIVALVGIFPYLAKQVYPQAFHFSYPCQVFTAGRGFRRNEIGLGQVSTSPGGCRQDGHSCPGRSTFEDVYYGLVDGTTQFPGTSSRIEGVWNSVAIVVPVWRGRRERGT